MPKMRILLVAHYLPPNGVGGVQIYTANTAQKFREQGHTVAIYARGTRTDVPDAAEETTERFGADIEVTEAHSGGRMLSSADRTRSLLASQFEKVVEKFKPDIVHINHLLYHSLDYPLIAKRAGAIVVMTLHDLWYTCPTIHRLNFESKICERLPGRGCLPCLWGGRRAKIIAPAFLAGLSDRPFAKRLLDLSPIIDELEDWAGNSARCLREADAVISPSLFLADDLVRAGIDVPSLIVCDNGIPAPDFTALHLAEAMRPKDCLLHFGIIGAHRVKGTQVAVEAFRELTGLPVVLHLFGVDSYPNVPENVRVAGRYTASELERVYGAFDVLIVPSIWYENAPLVVREAFARNRPVIASNIGGMKESVRHEIDGLHFAVGDADSLACAVRQMATEPGLLATLRQGIRLPKFYDVHIAELLSLYTTLQLKQKAAV